jgi:hypothetical protein
MKINDRFIIRLTYFYIGLPFILFVIGWLRWYYSLPIVSLFLYSIYLSQKSFIANDEFSKIVFSNKKVLLSIFLCLATFIFFSGIGSYSFQHDDHHYRNAIFQDLIEKSWPVKYHIEGFATENPLEGKQTFLAYYLGYWLPAAIVGKLFGLKAGSFALYLWSLLGLNLVFYFFCKYFKTYSLKMLWLFLGWGSLYVIGTFYSFPIKEVLKGNVYLWAGNMLYADGNTGLIYWTFNQTITPWLILLLIINQTNSKNLVFLASLVLFYGPFPFIGLIPFLGYFILSNDVLGFQSKFNFSQFILKYLTVENLLGGCTVMLISYSFFSSNSAGNVFRLAIPQFSTYFIFVFLSIGIISILIFDRFKSNPLYYLVLVVLLVLPLFQLGFGLDLTARASIPAMFILMLLVVDYILNTKTGFRKKLVIYYMIVSFLCHNIQLFRSVYYTSLDAVSRTNLGEVLVKKNNKLAQKTGAILIANKDKNLTIKNDLDSLNNPNNILVRNFMGLTEGSFFYNYLAKQEND